MPAGSYTKVVNIWMENKDANSIIGSSSAPFANQMANTYGSATNFRTIVHPSRPNYVAATSGGTQGITDDAAGKSWKAYQEGMTSNCMTSNTGRYAVKHNPGRITCRCGHRAKSTRCPWAPRPVAISSTTSKL
jgi:phosphatidylinositol-3-phosphatase